MNANEFKETMDRSFGLQLIITGLTTLVEDEGYTPRDAFNLLEATKQNTFHALSEIRKEAIK